MITPRTVVPGAAGGADLDDAADRADAVPHADDADPVRRDGRVEADSVVLDGQDDLILPALERDADLGARSSRAWRRSGRLPAKRNRSPPRSRGRSGRARCRRRGRAQPPRSPSTEGRPRPRAREVPSGRCPARANEARRRPARRRGRSPPAAARARRRPGRSVRGRASAGSPAARCCAPSCRSRSILIRSCCAVATIRRPGRAQLLDEARVLESAAATVAATPSTNPAVESSAGSWISAAKGRPSRVTCVTMRASGSFGISIGAPRTSRYADCAGSQSASSSDGSPRASPIKPWNLVGRRPARRRPGPRSVRDSSLRARAREARRRTSSPESQAPGDRRRHPEPGRHGDAAATQHTESNVGGDQRDHRVEQRRDGATPETKRRPSLAHEQGSPRRSGRSL